LVGIVIVSHGDMADGLVDAARMIAGEQEGIATVSLREMDAVEELVEWVAAAIQKVDSGDGVVILVDLFGGTPFNASARLAMQGDHKIELVSGVNLPMLVELAVQRETKGLEQLLDIALQEGTSGIRSLSQTLAGNTAS
jgi:PTS system mannose-specific IIA component